MCEGERLVETGDFCVASARSMILLLDKEHCCLVQYYRFGKFIILFYHITFAVSEEVLPVWSSRNLFVRVCASLKILECHIASVTICVEKDPLQARVGEVEITADKEFSMPCQQAQNNSVAYACVHRECQHLWVLRMQIWTLASLTKILTIFFTLLIGIFFHIV